MRSRPIGRRRSETGAAGGPSGQSATAGGPIASLALGGLLAIGASFPAAPLAAQAGEGSVGLPLGTEAPAATVQDLDENVVELLDIVGDGPALIEFWATWCELCEALQPQLDEIHATYGDRVQVVAVAVAVSQSLRRVRRHVEEHDPGYPFLWDGRGNAVRAYRAPTTSVIVMLDAEGRVAYTGVGTDQDLVGAVESLLSAGGRAPPGSQRPLPIDSGAVDPHLELARVFGLGFTVPREVIATTRKSAENGSS